MMKLYSVCFAGLAAVLVPTVSYSKEPAFEASRPFSSEDSNIERILEAHWNSQSEKKECDCSSTDSCSYSPLVVETHLKKKPSHKIRYEINVRAECLPGGNFYTLQIKRINGNGEEVFEDAGLDASLGDSLFSTVPDTYRIHGKTQNMNEAGKKKLKSVNADYSALIKEVSGMLKK